MVLDAAVRPYADATGIPIDYLKLALCLALSCVLSPQLPRLPNATSRHVANVLVSTCFLVGIMHLYGGMAELVATSLVVYAIAKFRVGGRHMPWVAFAFEMGHIVVTHLRRQLVHVPLTTIEISAMHMVLCMNLTTFAWDCYDGQMRTEAECDAAQKLSRIPRMPSMLAFLGYCFYFPGVLVGPSTRFRDYEAWADGDLYRPALSPPPGRFRVAGGDIVFALAALATQAALSERYSYQRLADAADPVQRLSLGHRIVYVQLCGIIARTRYFGVWSLSDAACILSGLGYAGTDPATGRTEWTRGKNIYVLRFEFANNWKELLDAWNANTNVWLRNTVYKRVAKPGKRPGFKSTMLTFLVSALWHGTSPGYYFTFLLGGFFLSLARILRQYVRPIVFADPRSANPALSTLSHFTAVQLLYSAVSILLVQVTVNYAALSFLTLDVASSFRAWHALGWYGHILAAAGILLHQMGAFKPLRKLHKAKGAQSLQDAPKAKAM
ncbi:hypothetical protein MSPP1_003355 [Malassezia sp. CBS 17886]|nr:hypothetical protein MSPP1_003355 [Malassezia sp. CBS 17886]